MKAENISEFWSWFARSAGVVGFDPTEPEFVHALDEKVRTVEAGLSWEIGSGGVKAWTLVISAGFNAKLRVIACALIEAAPDLPQWEFLSSRPPKHWDYVFQLERYEGEALRIDATDWTFVLLQYPDRSQEILLKGDVASEMSEDERREAATVVLESILGEEKLMDFAGSYELVGHIDARFISGQRPIQQLSEAISRRTV